MVKVGQVIPVSEMSKTFNKGLTKAQHKANTQYFQTVHKMSKNYVYPAAGCIFECIPEGFKLTSKV